LFQEQSFCKIQSQIFKKNTLGTRESGKALPKGHEKKPISSSKMAPLFLVLLFLHFPSSTAPLHQLPTAKADTISCTDTGCQGTYYGPEFVDGRDVAHQFSNTMSAQVGDKLKELYKRKKYAQVDFSSIEMSTKGMGSGTVQYSLSIPFLFVNMPCEAYTSFDHVGGWNHVPALHARKAQLSKALMEGETLYLSDLKTTPEGLQEYWIQWKNKKTQVHCKR
jgi:hypothetical protein